MIGERCGQCEFYAYHTSSFDCCVPKWIPLKNVLDINERMPEDCPIRKVGREEVKRKTLKELKNEEH